MKTTRKFLTIGFFLMISRIAFGYVITLDSIRVTPSTATVHDSIFLSTYSLPFSGDCTYESQTDSIINNTIFISGKYDSNCKCITDGANDTLYLGKFPAGTYTIDYSLIDTHSYIQTSKQSINFTISQITGLGKSYDEEKKIKVYPNPCDTYVKISLSSDISTTKHVQLYNSIGQLEFEKTFPNTDSELTINMSNYQKGLYFLRINSNKATTIKLIKK